MKFQNILLISVIFVLIAGSLALAQTGPGSVGDMLNRMDKIVANSAKGTVAENRLGDHAVTDRVVDPNKPKPTLISNPSREMTPEQKERHEKFLEEQAKKLRQLSDKQQKEFEGLTQEGLDNLKKLKADQLRKLSDLGNENVDKISQLNEGQIKRLTTIGKEQFERFAKLEKNQLEKFEKLQEEQLHKFGKLQERQLEKFAKLNEDQINNLSDLDEEILEEVSEFEKEEIEAISELDEETRGKLHRLNKDQLMRLASLKDAKKIKDALKDVPRLSNAVKNFNLQKDKLLKLKDNLQDAKHQYHTAKTKVKLLREKIANAPEESRAVLEAELVDRIAQALFSEITAIINRLETWKENGNPPEGVDALIEKLHGFLDRLESEDLTINDLREISNELKEIWKEAKQRGQDRAVQAIFDRLDNLLEKISTKFERSNEVIEKIEAAGASQELLDRINNRKTALDEQLTKLKEKLEELKKAAASDDETTVKEVVQKAKRFAHASVKVLRQHIDFMHKLGKILHRLEHNENTDDITIEEKLLTVEEAEIEVDEEEAKEEEIEEQEETEIEIEAEEEFEEEAADDETEDDSTDDKTTNNDDTTDEETTEDNTEEETTGGEQ